MDINQINDVVFEYLAKMIKDDDKFDIYNITEYQYDYDIVETMLNMWEESYCPDIITEHFGNQSFFEPSLRAFGDMLGFITEKRRECDMETPYNLFNGINIHHTFCNVLRHYAYWYIYSMGYEGFLLKLKYYVEDE
jgi:hypothetical protein